MAGAGIVVHVADVDSHFAHARDAGAQIEQIVLDGDEPDETRWLYNHCNEAIAAWPAMSEDRMVILVRSVPGGLLTDEEVASSLEGIPEWWTEG